MQLRTDDVTWRQVENEIILLDLRRSTYLRLNPAGTLLWTRLADGEDESGLTEALMARYGASEERASRDVRAFLDQLRDSELLR